jgi:hypothetical protein
MKSGDRMFRVLVLGGIALTACGGATASTSSGTDSGTGADSGGGKDSGPGQDGFPQEGPAQVDAFPSETAQQIDSSVGVDAGNDTGPDGFPTEGPAMIDSGFVDTGAADVGSDVPCFPVETALPDAGCITPGGD